MTRFVVKCDTVLAVDAEDTAEATVAFIKSLNHGGFHYTVVPVKEEHED